MSNEELLERFRELFENFLDSGGAANRGFGRTSNGPSRESIEALEQQRRALELRERELQLIAEHSINLQAASDAATELARVQREIRDLERQITEAAEARREAMKAEAEDAETGGRASRMKRKGQKNWKKGEALRETYGDNSIRGKIGKGMQKLGNAQMTYAKKLSWVTMAIEALCKVVDFATEIYKMNTEAIKIENKYRLEILKFSYEYAKENLNYNYNLLKNDLTTNIAVFKEAYGLYTGNLATATEVVTQSFTDIKGAMFGGAEHAISAAANYMKFEQHKTMAFLKQALESQNINLEHIANMTKIEGQEKTAEVERKIGLEKNEWQKASYIVNTIIKTLDLSGLLSMMSKSATGGIGAIKERGWVMEEFKNKMTVELANLQTQFGADAQKKINEIVLTAATAASEAVIDAIVAVEREQKAWLKLTQTIYDSFLKMEDAAYKMGRGMGFSGKQLSDYSLTMANFQVAVAPFGKTLEDMMKLQTGFQSETGFNRHLSQYDYQTSFANGMWAGDDTVAQLNSGMEIFNMSVAHGNEMFFEMYKQTSKIGLNAQKYAKSLVKNIGLAQKYNFKGGVQGLMNMAKWAQQTRFNMDSMDGILDKVQKGGLEGVIKQAAELQVLGGNFAMGANPMAMAWEVYNDPDAYAKRLNDMLAGQGYFDYRSGEVKFGGTSQQIIRQMAESTGLDYKDLQNQARQKVRISEIGKTFNNSQGFNQDQMSLIANNAVWENGQWKVNINQGKESKSVGLNELTTEQLRYLIPQDIDRGILQTAMDIRSHTEKMTAAQLEMNDKLQVDHWIEMQEKTEEWIDKVWKAFVDDQTNINQQITDNLNKITEVYENYVNMYMTGDDGMRKLSLQMEANTIALGENTTKLGSIAGEMQQAILNAMSSEEVKKALGNPDASTIGNLTERNLENWVNESGWSNDSWVEAALTLNDFTKGGEENLNSETVKQILEYLNKQNGARKSDSIKDILQRLQYLKDKQYVTGNDEIGYYYKTTDGWTWDDYVHYKNVKFDDNQASAEGISMFDPKWTSTDDIPVGVATPRNFKDEKVNDGFVSQSGSITRIDSLDQVLIAKEKGPISQLLSMLATGSLGGSISNGPIQISVSGNIQVHGDGKTFMMEMMNSPEMVRAFSQTLALQIQKSTNQGKITSVLTPGMITPAENMG